MKGTEQHRLAGLFDQRIHVRASHPANVDLLVGQVTEADEGGPEPVSKGFWIAAEEAVPGEGLEDAKGSALVEFEKGH